jgi:hypothetical protein
LINHHRQAGVLRVCHIPHLLNVALGAIEEPGSRKISFALRRD